jgi:hypothetical protein
MHNMSRSSKFHNSIRPDESEEEKPADPEFSDTYSAKRKKKLQRKIAR